ncbi:putative translation initiation factor eif-2b beta subunit putativeeIF-2B GDP-GTP exchange factor [Leptomonas pyrrhocoris]|uniref:Translation initiation factor eIF2B subunit beta n=1 Tax=Leptomonas pyrrhocoris TaxID=157538 RepID=A0A0N0VDU2_LEPPY|nr:putative translation initiation factor eif-2b beta subunit putativeeIF-2B GDP-GTP exchange factor [Leptomonas pyrrhocoris]KPA76032.1 putative translation initiation factor eif-2b beta subunit putativeeIF-2B GDP-GTP exchange factor [Leptomonas pyrrhocoris]|eukprot:XP_015654471.1 putative translation initiation factor eif-2b beta subunit putativeeIF-2B GDP-GTP exchange factor [Leptomonas pyrrhocoris]
MANTMSEESEELLGKVSNLAEAFITDLKRGCLAGARSGEESLSTAAAVKMAEMMASIVRLFQNTEEDPQSRTVQLLKAGYPAAEVASLQVSRLLILVARTGDSLLRAQFATLFLMNVTRRVLSIVRESAANNKATEAELELDAKAILEDLKSEDDEEENNQNSARSSSSSSSNASEESDDDAAKHTLPAKGMKPASPALKKNAFSADPYTRRGLSVRFADRGEPSPYQQHSASMANDFGSPLLQRAGSIVAMEIPGRQVLKRAPSRREQVQEEESPIEFPVRVENFYTDALEAIDELKRELEGMTEELCRRAPRQLHSSDTIITLGCSHSIRRYLLEAAKAGQHFKVLILEGAPQPAEATQEFAAALLREKIHAQLLPDSSAYVVMSMCTKVLVGAENVLANGGMLTAIGTHVLCAAARHFAVPVLVVTTTLKMSPYYPSDQLCTRLVRIARSGAQEMPWSTYGSPEDVWPSPFGVAVSDSGRGLTIHAPVTEYVPPELITLFVTNDSELMPSQIHRIVRANYSDAD